MAQRAPGLAAVARYKYIVPDTDTFPGARNQDRVS